MVARDLHGPAVKIVKSEVAAESSHVGFRFVITGKHVHLLRALLQYGPHRIEAAAEIRQVAGRKIVIGFDGHQFFERGLVAVDIGEDQKLHVVFCLGTPP